MFTLNVFRDSPLATERVIPYYLKHKFQELPTPVIVWGCTICEHSFVNRGKNVPLKMMAFGGGYHYSVIMISK